MSMIDYLHAEAEMLQVEDHSELLSAQYLAKCLQPKNACHDITTRGPPLRMMKHTLYTRHRTTVEPLMTDGILKDTLKSILITAVNKAVAKQKRNRVPVFDDLPSPISNNEANLPRKQRTTLS